jgi:hypothetical protein
MTIFCVRSSPTIRHFLQPAANGDGSHLDITSAEIATAPPVPSDPHFGGLRLSSGFGFPPRLAVGFARKHVN